MTYRLTGPGHKVYSVYNKIMKNMPERSYTTIYKRMNACKIKAGKGWSSIIYTVMVAE